jgi:hypothetical protein
MDRGIRCSVILSHQILGNGATGRWATDHITRE